MTGGFPLRVGAVGIALAALLAPFPAVGRSMAAAGSQNLGTIDFPTSIGIRAGGGGSGAAQEHFVRGALLLHSFMYDDAAEEFQEAQKAAPGFAMAYWGEAMTKNHPLWMQRDAAAARTILERLGPTRKERLAKAPTKREQGYLTAVEELYAAGEKKDRDLAYADAMRRLHEEFPDDLEAQSFYALALLGTCEEHRDAAVYMKGAALAEEVFAKNPLHPGAVHYLIHAYDDPVHAPLGLRPARVYARIAGAAAHALHMPSHIFLALGMWDDVIASNEQSWAAAEERVGRKHLGADERGWHGIYWREYALLQEGRVREARALLDVAEADARGGLGRVVGARSEMRAAYAVATSCAGWAPPEKAAEEAGKAEAAANPRDQFVRGYCAWKTRDGPGLAAAIAGLRMKDAAAPVDSGGHAHGAPAYAGSDAAASEVYRIELEALERAAAGDAEGAVTRARQAAAAEDGMSFEFGPPVVVKPAHELLGELYAVAGKPVEARAEFEAALARAPGRAASLEGEIRAAAAAKDPESAREAEKLWRRFHGRADVKTLPWESGAVPRAGAAR